MPTLRERLSGGLLGLLVGDALGVPYEFHSRSALPPSAEIDFTPPAKFRRSHSSVPSGTWSDDGAQALCLLSTLLDRGGLDLPHFSENLLRWYRDGDFTPDQRRFDCGLQTLPPSSAWRMAFRRTGQVRAKKRTTAKAP